MSDLRAQAAAFLRQAHRSSRAIGERFDLGERTARRALAGQVSGAVLHRMAKAFEVTFTQHIWFDGRSRTQTNDPNRFIADKFGYDPADNLVGSIQRNLGWVLVSRSLNCTSISYAKTGAHEEALRMAGTWLANERPAVVSVEHEADGIYTRQLLALAEALDLIAQAADRSERREAALAFSLSIERRGLQNVVSLEQVRLLRARAQIGSRAALLKAIYDGQLFPSSALYRRRGDVIVPFHMGPKLGVSASECGRDVRDRADKVYASNVHRLLLEAARSDEPTFYSMRHPINGEFFTWDALRGATKPERDGTQLLWVISDVKERAA